MCAPKVRDPSRCRSHLADGKLVLVIAAVISLLAPTKHVTAQTCPFEHPKLVPHDPTPGTFFGLAVDVEGERVVVGAPRDDPNGSSSGSVYVFRREDSGTPLDPTDDLWIEEAKLTPADGQAGDYFGRRVSIADPFILVSASSDDDACPKDPECNSGSAYVFVRDDQSDQNWVELTKLTASDANGSDYFGGAVSIGENWAVIGAPRTDDACPPPQVCDFGSAYVFRRDRHGTPDDPTDDEWVEHVELLASDAARHDRFGNAVDISGDWIIVGTSTNGWNGLSAFVFLRQDAGTPGVLADDTWAQAQKLVQPDPNPSLYFAASCSIDRELIAVGAYLDDDMGENAGAVYVYRYTGTEWEFDAKITSPRPAEGGHVGLRVSLSGNRVAAADFPDNAANSAHIWRRGGNGTWHLEAMAVSPSVTTPDYYASAVSLDADLLVVAAPGDDEFGTDAGSVIAFTLTESFCGDGCCLAGEDCAACPEDCLFGCGDGCCDGEENACNCPRDCSTPACGDGCCNGAEDCESCPADCTPGCGDRCCTDGETACTCPEECPVACGDGCCTGGEDCYTCPEDCVEICGNWLDDDCDGLFDCDDPDCPDPCVMIPATSEWGMMALMLLVATAGTIILARHGRAVSVTVVHGPARQ